MPTQSSETVSAASAGTFPQVEFYRKKLSNVFRGASCLLLMSFFLLAAYFASNVVANGYGEANKFGDIVYGAMSILLAGLMGYFVYFHVSDLIAPKPVLTIGQDGIRLGPPRRRLIPWAKMTNARPHDYNYVKMVRLEVRRGDDPTPPQSSGSGKRGSDKKGSRPEIVLIPASGLAVSRNRLLELIDEGVRKFGQTPSGLSPADQPVGQQYLATLIARAAVWLDLGIGAALYFFADGAARVLTGAPDTPVQFYPDLTWMEFVGLILFVTGIPGVLLVECNVRRLARKS